MSIRHAMCRAVRSRIDAKRDTDESGVMSVLVAAMFASGMLLALAAFAVDVSKWYLEQEGIQKAADAAALAGVPFLPQDLPSAKARALEVAARNGFDHTDPRISVTVDRGELPSQLRVTISSTIGNSFGASFGVDETTLTRSATANYQGPAPMGSPCNTFGNEPDAGSGSGSPSPSGTVQGSPAFSNCPRRPQFWATVEGPETGKVQGDRYQTLGCENDDVDGCDSSKTNEEYDEFGYVFIVKVEEQAVGRQVDLQLYDPIFFNVFQRCQGLPLHGSFSNTDDLLNPYVLSNEARQRYSSNGVNSAAFCTGDDFAGAAPRTVPVTSFALRQQVDSLNPAEAPVQNGTDGAPCIRQFSGVDNYPSPPPYYRLDSNLFRSSSPKYIEDAGKYFHNWASFCTFVPQRAGDYYLQVRTNVDLGGSCSTTGWACRGNTDVLDAEGDLDTGSGSNSFAIRAKTEPGAENFVSVSGYNHMPIFVNSDAATVDFNLIRVLPGAAGGFIRFSYFDAGDAQGSGSVKVITPPDAIGSVTTDPFPGGCRSFGGSAGGSEETPTAVGNCTAPFEQADSSTSKNNGKTQTIDIPIPGDYNCSFAQPDGCWYRVQVAFGDGTVNDVTTWDAQIVGDPVRLVK